MTTKIKKHLIKPILHVAQKLSSHEKGNMISVKDLMSDSGLDRSLPAYHRQVNELQTYGFLEMDRVNRGPNFSFFIGGRLTPKGQQVIWELDPELAKELGYEKQAA